MTIEFKDVVKSHRQGRKAVRALNGVSLRIEPGASIAVMGPSGSGKSTLLHLAGTLDVPTAGEVLIDGEATTALSDAARTRLRRCKIGFVFQFFNLLPTLTVAENVALPLLLQGMNMSQAGGKTVALLGRVGLGDRAAHLPEELSGGEMQRVGIARALVIDPEVLLMDEPTGNLDTATGKSILELVKALAGERKTTVVLVTHDVTVAGYAESLVSLRDGKLDTATSAAL